MPFRRYSLLATAGVVPLVLMVMVLVAFQFDSQRRALLEELADQAVEHNILLSNVIKTVQDHVQRLTAWSEIYAQIDAPVGLFVPVGEPRRVVDGGLVLHGRDFAVRSGAAADNWLAHQPDSAHAPVA